MKNINPIEEEVNTIREKIYEEIKNMTPSEMTAYVRQQVMPMHKKFGFRTIQSARSRNTALVAR